MSTALLQSGSEDGRKELAPQSRRRKRATERKNKKRKLIYFWVTDSLSVEVGVLLAIANRCVASISISRSHKTNLFD